MRRSILAAVAAVMVLAPSVEAQISARSAEIRIGGRLHQQFDASSVDGEASNFFTRRARLIVDGTFNDFISGRVQADFAGTAKLVDAYIRMNFSPEFRVSFGQFKRSFDIFELASSTDLSLIERTGKVTGYDMCTGVGSICSYSRLTEALGYADRDSGIRVDGSSGTFSYQATLTNGTKLNSSDENDGKTFAGRVSLMAAENVQVSANAAVKDYLDPADETQHAVAFGGDVQVGTWRDGLLVQGSVVSGDNWMSLDGADNPGGFVTSQVAVSFYFPVDGDRIAGIEPIGRISVADPDDGIDDDGGLLITPGFMIYFMGKNKIGFNYDYYSPATGDSVSGFRFGTFLYF